MAPSQAVLDHLRRRRSVPPAQLEPPGPGEAELEDILTIASRVPDHGKIAPWRFVILSGDPHRRFLDRLMEIWRDDNPDADENSAALERGKRPQAPLLVVLVFRPTEHPKVPEWEQHLATGAVGLNLLHAVHAHGYAGQWLTGWPATDGRVAELLGLGPGERIAGFFHVGTPAAPQPDRDRPDIAALTTRWSPV